MNSSLLHRIWRVVRIPLGVIVVLYVGLVIYRIPAAFERDKTEKAVERIHAQKLQMKDVTGENLPPEPDATLKDATVAGIDANANGIRDDVELAIFKLHPDPIPPERSGSSTQIRAAQLQYAMALQMELTEVFNSETLIAAIQETTRGGLCISNTVPKVSLDDTKEIIKATFALSDVRQKEVDDLFVNTDTRKKKQEEVFKYLTSHGDKEGPVCDINLESLPN